MRVYRAGELIPAGTTGELANPNSIGEPVLIDGEDSPPTAIASEAQLMDTLTGKVAAGPISRDK